MYILYLDSNLDHDLMAVPNPVIRPGGLNLYGLAPLGRRVDIDKRTTINSYQFQFSHYSSDLNKNRPKHNPIMSATMEKDRVSAESDDQTYSSEEQPKKQRRTKKKGTKTSRRKQQQQQQSGPLDQLPVGGDLGNTVGGVTNTLGGVTGGALNQQQGGDDGGKSDTLRLRLDLNLDIEIQLKARIHGDLELALLYVLPPFLFPSSPVPLSPVFCLAVVSYLAFSNLQHRVRAEGTRANRAVLSLQRLIRFCCFELQKLNGAFFYCCYGYPCNVSKCGQYWAFLGNMGNSTQVKYIGILLSERQGMSERVRFCTVQAEAPDQSSREAKMTMPSSGTVTGSLQLQTFSSQFPPLDATFMP
jgi:hypothetical protein